MDDVINMYDVSILAQALNDLRERKVMTLLEQDSLHSFASFGIKKRRERDAMIPTPA